MSSRGANNMPRLIIIIVNHQGDCIQSTVQTNNTKYKI
jgi:hypothetical protein